jgi:hypothetical protein
MRLVAGIALIQDGVVGLRGGLQLALAMPSLVAASGGIFLLAGLWTPVAGGLVAVIERGTLSRMLGISRLIFSWLPSLLP